MTAQCDITLYNNGAWSRSFQLQDGTSAPISLVGTTLEMMVRPTAGSPIVFLSLTTGSGITITDAANGKFRIDITEAQLSRLSGTYVHDIVPTVGGIDGQPLWSGSLTVLQGVTR